MLMNQIDYLIQNLRKYSKQLVPMSAGSPKRENGMTSSTAAVATNLSLKQRVNSVVMKALAINSEMGRVNPR